MFRKRAWCCRDSSFYSPRGLGRSCLFFFMCLCFHKREWITKPVGNKNENSCSFAWLTKRNARPARNNSANRTTSTWRILEHRRGSPRIAEDRWASLNWCRVSVGFRCVFIGCKNPGVDWWWWRQLRGWWRHRGGTWLVFWLRSNCWWWDFRFASSFRAISGQFQCHNVQYLTIFSEDVSMSFISFIE